MTVLDERLDARVDAMVQRGLREELLSFYRAYRIAHGHSEASSRGASGQRSNYAEGVWQSIGLKEFLPYLLVHEEGEAESVAAAAVWAQCVAELKQHTRQLARQQAAWIRNRWRYRAPMPLYALDATPHPTLQLDLWRSRPLAAALALATQFVREGNVRAAEAVTVSGVRVLLPLTTTTAASSTTAASATSTGLMERFERQHRVHECTQCNRSLHGDDEWTAHLRSRQHRRRLQTLRRSSANANRRHDDAEKHKEEEEMEEEEEKEGEEI